MSTPFSLNIALDADSLARLHAFEHYETALEPALLKAMDASTAMLQAFATDFMWSHFRHPGGQLEDADSWETEIVSPYLAWVGNNQPYARRRNYGFSNRTDALGRYYAHDWGIEWAEDTVILEQYKVEVQFQAAIDYANLQLGRGTP